MTVNRASARYEGFGKEGKGSITTKSGVLGIRRPRVVLHVPEDLRDVRQHGV